MNVQDIETKWAFLANHKVFVACSGGVDSVVLLHILKSICKDIEVLHVNYCLRGEDSNSDEQFVRELCSSLNIPLKVKKVNTKAFLQKNGGNLQEVARKIRYDFFQENLNENEGSYVALGQHSDDQLETFFQHLARKSGILGMSCMLEEHDRYLRPLLSYSKQDILNFALEKRLDWREDKSNQENKYTRNRLRNIILPALNKEIPTLNASVQTLVEVFQSTQKELELQAKGIHARIISSSSWNYNEFDSLSFELRGEVLRQFGGTFEVLAQLEKIRLSQKGKKVVCGNYVFYHSVNAFEVNSITKVSDEYAQKFEIQIVEVETIPNEFSKTTVYFDKEKISGDLVLRIWQIGDRIAPIGMQGTKLISDVLTEAKISSGNRQKSLVVTDDVDVLWCIGHKISRKCIATKKSDAIIKVEIVEKKP